MPINVNAGLPGAIIGLLALLRSQGRQSGTPASEAQTAPAASAAQAASAPQRPAAVPDSSDSAVRFDFSVSPVQAAPAAPAPGETTSVTAGPPAGYVPAAAPPPAVADSTPAAASSLPAGAAAGAAPTGFGAAGTGQRNVPAAASPEPARLPSPVAPDDEAMARAWAVRSLARENTLSMIERIARMAEPPEKAKAPAESDSPGRVAQPAEPKTLARA